MSDILQIPNRGDFVLVSDNCNGYYEEIFLEYIPGAKRPVVVVRYEDRDKYFAGKKFRTVNWKHFKV